MNNSEYTSQPLYGEATQTAVAYHPEVRAAFIAKVFRTFAFALLLSIAGVWAGFALYSSMPVSPLVHYGIIIVEFALILSAGWWYNKLPLGYFLFALFAFTTGVTALPILALALQVGSGPILIIKALAATTATFGAAALFGWATNKDLSSWGSMLFIGLIGIVIASVINIFVGSSMMDMVLSGATVLIITAFTAYDIQMIKQRYSEDMFLLAGIALYLDFFILFKNILFFLISLSQD